MWLMKTLAYLLVGLSSLLTTTQQQQQSSLSTTYMEQSFSKLNQTHTKEVTGARQAYIRVLGYGTLEVRVHRGDIVYTANNCSSTYGHEHSCLLWSFSDLSFDNKEVFLVEVKLIQLGSQQVSLKLLGGEFIEVEPHGLEIFTGSTHSADLLIHMKGLKNLDAAKSRVQFCVKQIENVIRMQQTLDIYVAKGKTKVQPIKSEYSSHAKMALGTMVTILPSDQMHCIDDCYYSVHLEFSNVELLGFFMIIKSSDPVISLFHNSIRLLENLRPKDQTTYIFETADQNVAWNWRFFVSPIEGNPDIAVHFDKKPDSITGYHWRSNQAQMEGIFIKEAEIKQQGFKTRKAYVTVYSDVGATFFLQIAVMKPGDPVIIQADSPYSSFIEVGGQNNYLYQLDVPQPTKVEVYAKLRVLQGDADLYVKSCSEKNPSCIITTDELKGWTALETTSNEKLTGLYKRSREAGLVDETLLLKYNCIPNSAEFVNFTFGNPDVYETRNCGLGLAVIGQQSGPTNGSNYIIELKFSKFLTPLAPEKQLQITIPPDSIRYFKVERLEPTAHHKYFTLKLLLNSGAAKVWMSQKTQYPGDSAHDKFSEVQPDYDTNIKTLFLSLAGNQDSLQKPVYIAIKVVDL